MDHLATELASTVISHPSPDIASPPARPTDGPWVQFAIDRKCVAIMPAGREGDICTFDQSPSDADARLMTLAPMLLKALRNCRNRLKMDLDEIEHLRGWLSKSELAERAVQDEAADEADRLAISDADELLAAIEVSTVSGDRTPADAKQEAR